MKRGVLLGAVSCVGVLLYAQVLQKRGVTSRVSVSSSEEQGDHASTYPTISANGRYVAFNSGAGNLVQGDTNSLYDVFLHDRQTRQTTLVSVSSSGGQGNGFSGSPSLSADGRYVAFHSDASTLVPGDTNTVADVFVHDRQTLETTRVSVSSSGEQGDLNSLGPSISADGRYVAFSSWSSNLVDGDSNGRLDVFVYDRQTGQPMRLSVSSGGGQGNGNSERTSISADGRFVAFQSVANNLVEGDTNEKRDEFVHDRQTGQTTRVSVASGGQQGNFNSLGSSISADGRHVAFTSWASNLTLGDTNDTYDVFVHDRHTEQTTRVSVSSNGQQGNSESGYYGLSLSGDGRYVAFSSGAGNLVTGDTNNLYDVFMHDRQTGQTTRVSVSSNGQQGNNESGRYGLSISTNGSFVAFWSDASNLVAGDTNFRGDIFVHRKALVPSRVPPD